MVCGRLGQKVITNSTTVLFNYSPLGNFYLKIYGNYIANLHIVERQLTKSTTKISYDDDENYT